MRTVIREPTVDVIQQADKIEQRSDVRISLSIVVSEKAFVIPYQAREHIRHLECVVLRKPFVKRELETAKVPASAAKARAEIIAGTILSIACKAALRRPESFARIKDEISVTIIERSVLDDRTLRTVDPSESKRKVASQFSLKTSRHFVNGLRLDTLIDICRIRAKISRIEV